MKIQTQYLTTFNSYPENTPTAIIVHNTDNFNKTANAKAHAEGLKNGNMQDMSWHVVVDDKEAYQCLPYNRGAWHVGVNYGNKTLFGKINNRNSVCVEMCVNAGYDYEKAFQNTVDVVKQLMAKLKIPADKVYQHYDICNKDCPSQIRKRGDWNRFKSLIVGKWYRVRKSWKDEKSQLGAYQVLQNAKENCPVGYSVYDESGKAIYTPVDAVASVHGKKYPSGVPTSKEAYIEAVGSICRELQAETGILASVVTAQCCLETGFGLAADCKVLMDVNNLLGMKTDLINNTWDKWTVWTGSFITKKTPEYQNGKLIYINDQFRVYSNYENCIRDYEMFLLHVRNNKGYKYASVRGMTDPAAVIRKIRIGTGTAEHPEGYCTDPNYEKKILNIISQFNLTRYDAAMKEAVKAPTVSAPVSSSDKYVVRKTFKDVKSQTNSFNILDNAKKEADRHPGYSVYEAATGKCIYTSPTSTKDIYGVQWDLTDEGNKHRLGKFHDLANAKSLADLNWGYKVFNLETGKVVYAPKLAKWQELCGYLVRMDLIVRDDIKAGKKWTYRNKNTSKNAKTFDAARKDNNRHINCVSGVQWGLIGSGAVPADRKAIQWYGGADRIVWVGKDAEKNCKKYFHVIRVGNKTVKQAIKDGTVVPGDILTYVRLSHTNAYLGNGLSFDTGHAFCSGSGEGAEFKHWIGATPYQGYKVAYILRLKG